MHEKAKPRVIEGRKATVLLWMLNLSKNVLLELVLIEGWTAECIFTGIVHGGFLFLLEGNQVKLISRHSPTFSQIDEKVGSLICEIAPIAESIF